MGQELTFRCETVGQASYLVAAIDNPDRVVHYQMQMMENNEIPYLLSTKQQRQNHTIEIYYNVTSNITFAQATSRNKIKKTDFIIFLNSLLDAYDALEEYQLVDAGILLDERYIYVNIGNFKPQFVYLPFYTQPVGITALKNFLMQCIMQSKFEMTNDNFVQLLLDTLNQPDCTRQTLRAFLNGTPTPAGAAQQQTMQNNAPLQQMESAQQAQRQQAPLQNMQSFAAQQQAFTAQQNVQAGQQAFAAQQTAQAAAQQAFYQQQATAQKATFVSPDQQSSRYIAPEQQSNLQMQSGKPTFDGKSPQKPKKKEKQKTVKPEKTTHSVGKKIGFAVIQLVCAAAVGFLAYRGLFVDAQQAIQWSYILGVLVAVFGIDFVLYRELFVNTRKKEKTTAAAGKGKQKAMPPQSQKGKQPKMPPQNAGKPMQQTPMQRPVPPQNPVQPPVQPMPKNPVQSPVQSMPPQNPVQPVQPVMAAQPQNVSFDALGEENTVMMTDENTDGAYLQYYENGLPYKIRLNKPSILVGKLKSQVDFVITNNKISKIHAEFICRNGQYFVKDYNSLNGTYINNPRERINSNVEYPIYQGDHIFLANVELILQC